MLIIGNSTPDLAAEAFMPDGRFARLRLGALAGRDAAAHAGLPGGRVHSLRTAAGRWRAGGGPKRGEQP
jgi:hypothetical protein